MEMAGYRGCFRLWIPSRGFGAVPYEKQDVHAAESSPVAFSPTCSWGLQIQLLHAADSCQQYEAGWPVSWLCTTGLEYAAMSDELIA